MVDGIPSVDSKLFAVNGYTSLAPLSYLIRTWRAKHSKDTSWYTCNNSQSVGLSLGETGIIQPRLRPIDRERKLLHYFRVWSQQSLCKFIAGYSKSYTRQSGFLKFSLIAYKFRIKYLISLEYFDRFFLSEKLSQKNVIHHLSKFHFGTIEWNYCFSNVVSIFIPLLHVKIK